jgi:hypothetical protein
MAYSDAEILPDEQFSVFVGDSPTGAEGEELHAHVLVKLSNSGRLKDYHKLVCGGSYNLECRFGAADLIEAENMRHFRLRVERAPEELEFKLNSWSTKWADLDGLVASGKVLVSVEGMADDEATAEFRRQWEAARAAGSGAALRWVAHANPSYGFNLVLQALPQSARALRRDARLAASHSRGIQLGSWLAASNMGRHGQWEGPRPVFFAHDPAEARANLLAHPSRIETGKT